MTREEAREIVSKFISKHMTNDPSLEELYLDNPIIAKIYEEYMDYGSYKSPRWFYEKAENALIIANSKLGKALK